MKSMYNVKNRLRYIIVLLISACLLLVGGVLFNGESKVALAEGAPITFESGASIRIGATGESSGIRFTATISNDLYGQLTEKNGEKDVLKNGAELGMIILPSHYLAAYESGATEGEGYFEFFDRHEIARSKISIPFTPDMLKKTENGYLMYGSLVDLKASNYNRVFHAIAYYALPTASYALNTDYEYTVHKTERSITQVSVSAIQDETYASKYSDQQLDVLYMYANGEIPRVLYDASRTNHAQLLQTNSNVGVEPEASAFKFSLNETPAEQKLIITPLPQEINLSNYAGGTIYFTLKTDATGAGYSVGGFGSNLPQGEAVSIRVPVDAYINKTFKITVSGLIEGNNVWISDVAVCAKHKVVAWANPDANSHTGTCTNCNTEVEAACTAGKATYVANDDGTHLAATACTVCKQTLSFTQVDCTAGTPTYTANNDGTHTVSAICTVCQGEIPDTTEACTSTTQYTQVGDNQHTETVTCTVCGQVSSQTVTCSSDTCACGRVTEDEGPIASEGVFVNGWASDSVEEVGEDFSIDVIQPMEGSQQDACDMLISGIVEEDIGYYGDSVLTEIASIVSEDCDVSTFVAFEVHGLYVKNYQEPYEAITVNATFPTLYVEGEPMVVIVSFLIEEEESAFVLEHFVCEAVALEDRSVSFILPRDVLVRAEKECSAIISIVSEPVNVDDGVSCEHVFSGWAYNEDGHSRECALCGETETQGCSYGAEWREWEKVGDREAYVDSSIHGVYHTCTICTHIEYIRDEACDKQVFENGTKECTLCGKTFGTTEAPDANEEYLPRDFVVSATDDQFQIYSEEDLDNLADERQELFLEAWDTLLDAVPEDMAVRYFFYADVSEEDEVCNAVFVNKGFVSIIQYVNGDWVELEYVENEDETITVSDIVDGPIAILVESV